MVSIAVLIQVLTQQTNVMNPPPTPIYDVLFEYTKDANLFFADNPWAKNSYMIACSLMMDIMVLT